jgi:hypothetical protein
MNQPMCCGGYQNRIWSDDSLKKQFHGESITVRSFRASWIRIRNYLYGSGSRHKQKIKKNLLQFCDSL